jgi:hypothetical protein
MSVPKQLSFGETVKLVTDFSQELRRQPFPSIDPNVQRSLAPLPLSFRTTFTFDFIPTSCYVERVLLLLAAIAPRIEQRRFLAEHPPVLVVVKRIQNGAVYAEEQTRDGSRPARLVSMSEVLFIVLNSFVFYISLNRILLIRRNFLDCPTTVASFKTCKRSMTCTVNTTTLFPFKAFARPKTCGCSIVDFG